MFLIYIIISRPHGPERVETYRSYRSKQDIIHDFSLSHQEGSTITNPEQVKGYPSNIHKAEPLAYNICAGVQRTLHVLPMDEVKEYEIEKCNG